MKHIKGNLLNAFDEGCSYIAHICNAQGVMGSGAAKQIKEQWPNTYEHYRNYVTGVSADEALGACIITEDNICNLIAQEYYGTHKRQLHYGHLMHCLIRLGECCESLFDENVLIGIPYKMGCDRAGGDWEVVKEMLEGIESAWGVEFVAYELWGVV